MTKRVGWLLAVSAALLIAGCSAPPTTKKNDVEALARAIQALGPGVDPAEAERAARIAYSHGLQLAQDYHVTDPPVIHNAKVHDGFRERGLCNHYAEDMLKRLRQENFRTVTFHWATAPPKMFQIIHHTAAISPRGGSIEDGIILDPWRYGGPLFWSRPSEDTKYDWQPLMKVQEDLSQSREEQRPAWAK